MSDDVTPRCTAPSAALRAQEKSLLQRLELYSRKDVQRECERFARDTEEWDLSVSGRLERAALLCVAVREWLAHAPMERPFGTVEPRGLSAAEAPSAERVNTITPPAAPVDKEGE